MLGPGDGRCRGIAAYLMNAGSGSGRVECRMALDVAPPADAQADQAAISDDGVEHAAARLAWRFQRGATVFFETIRAGLSRASAEEDALSNDERTSRLLPLLGAFICGLVGRIGGIVYVTGHFQSPIGPAVGRRSAVRFISRTRTANRSATQDMKGRPFLVFFGFTHCPDICPTTLFEISQIMQKLGKDADRTGALFITVDPERDTPAALKDYLSKLRSASARSHRRSGRSRSQRSRPIGSMPRRFRWKTATTPWITPPSSI